MSDVSVLYDVQDGAVVLRVQASPGAGRSAVTGRHGDAVKVRVAAPPVDGRANTALVEFLAAEFGLKAADVTLVSGATSRAKRFRLGGLDPGAADAALERLLATAGTGGPRRPGRR
jgi:uncharacterized protein (TIGR00251 family)